MENRKALRTLRRKRKTSALKVFHGKFFVAYIFLVFLWIWLFRRVVLMNWSVYNDSLVRRDLFGRPFSYCVDLVVDSRKTLKPDENGSRFERKNYLRRFIGSNN